MNAARRPAPVSRCAARRRPRSRRAPLLLLSPLALVVFFLLLAPTSPAQTRAPSAAAAPPAAGESRAGGAITGRVLGEDGQPLPNVRVFASQTGGASGFSANAQSDEEGKFTLNALPFGAYLVNAFAPGYVLDPDPFDHLTPRVYHLVGDSVTLRMIKGGVITGTVTDSGGEPLVGIFIEALRTRGADGRPAREGTRARTWQPRMTDDRGVYRIYGLPPGAYVVRARGNGSFGPFTPHDLNAPTYYPSATRDGASEVRLQFGAEASGIDIRYRGEAGRAVSGTISGALPAGYPASGGIEILLKHAAAGAPEQHASILPGSDAFIFEGIADGDYELFARSFSTREGVALASPPQRVSVRGRDMTGITLALAPLASVSGRLLFDPPKSSPGDKSTCQPASAPRAVESIVVLRRDDFGNAADPSRAFFPAANETAPRDNGEFQFRNLKAGRYRLLVRLPAADLYVRAITLANAPAKNATPLASPTAVKSAPHAPSTSDGARAGFSLQNGESLSELNVHVATGAASLRGRVTAPAATGEAGAASEAANAALLRVHLVPAEREQADNPLRYAETRVAADGSFAFANLAPGRYWLVALPEFADAVNSPDNTPRPLALDPAARARLRREAETANAPVALAPCQRVADFVLPYPAR